jgi:hypothetical protein
MPEELRYGYISPNLYFNLFHAGFCAPYIANPNYMLLVDFRQGCLKIDYKHLMLQFTTQSFPCIVPTKVQQ